MKNLHKIGKDKDISLKDLTLGPLPEGWSNKWWEKESSIYNSIPKYSLPQYFTTPTPRYRPLDTYFTTDAPPALKTTDVRCMVCNLVFHGILPTGKTTMHMIHNPDGSHRPIFR